MSLLKILCTSLVLISSSLQAQEFEESQIPDSSDVKITKIGIGIKAGLNFATVSQGNLKKAPDARSGFYIGIIYELPIIDDVFSVQPEILYSQQGFEKKYTYLGERHTSSYKVDYINIPIVARYYVVRGFSLEVGPQFSYKLNENINKEETDTEFTDSNEINDFDFGIIAGLTFQFESGFFVSGRYNRSFTEIIKESKAKNTVIQLGIGYKF